MQKSLLSNLYFSPFHITDLALVLYLFAGSSPDASSEFWAQGIGKTGVNIVRVGRPEAIREDVKSYALDGRWKDSERDDGPTMAGFCKNELCSRVFRCVQFTASVDNVDMPHNSQDLKKAEVVCATCIGASGTTLDKVG